MITFKFRELIVVLDEDSNIRINKVVKSDTSKEITQFNDTKQAETKLFLIYVKAIEETAYFFNFFYFIGIDNNTFKMNFVYYESDYYDLKQPISFEFDFNEFFSCHTPFSSERQLKGIYFSNQTFFIFIKRFYLQIEDDLVSNQFSLADDYYRRNAKNFKLDQSHYKTVLFEYYQSKWTKTLSSSSVFCPSHIVCFQLNTDSNKNLLIKDLKSNYLISGCLEQTLVFDKHVYCFLEDTYFHLGKEDDKQYKVAENQYSIESIFQSSIVKWEDQKLKFTLNYKDNKFILMTITHIFVFEYDKFKSEMPDQIVAKYKNNENYFKIKSCLFLKCKPNSKPTTKSTKLTTAKSTTKSIIESNKDKITTSKKTNIDHSHSSKATKSIPREVITSYQLIKYPLIILMIILFCLSFYYCFFKDDESKKAKKKLTKSRRVFNAIYKLPFSSIKRVEVRKPISHKKDGGRFNEIKRLKKDTVLEQSNVDRIFGRSKSDKKPEKSKSFKTLKKGKRSKNANKLNFQQKSLKRQIDSSAAKQKKIVLKINLKN